jgi:hypothetical protein
MTQYLLSIYQPDGEAPSPEILEKVMRDVNALVQETKAAGVWVFNGGLHPPSTATVVRIRRGEALITDGPFAEAKEHIGGFLIVKAPDLDAALEWARSSRACSRSLVRVVQLPGCRSRSDRFITQRRTDRRRANPRPLGHRPCVPRGIRPRGGRPRPPIRRHQPGGGCRQDAFTVAVQRWPSAGLPASPAGWIITTARNRAIDRLRRQTSRDDRHAQAALLQASSEPPEEETEEGAVGDDRLRLIFTCCHPALALNVQVALPGFSAAHHEDRGRSPCRSRRWPSGCSGGRSATRDLIACRAMLICQSSCRGRHLSHF